MAVKTLIQEEYDNREEQVLSLTVQLTIDENKANLTTEMMAAAIKKALLELEGAEAWDEDAILGLLIWEH